MKHHRVEAKLLQMSELPIETLRGPGRGAVRVLTLADVPRPETKPVTALRHTTQSGAANCRLMVFRLELLVAGFAIHRILVGGKRIGLSCLQRPGGTE